MLIKLNRNYLKAMRLVTAKEDARYYLMGIYFVGGEGKVLAYATDGHQLMRWIVEDNYQGEDFEYIINRRAIKDAIKTKYDIHLNVETGEIICTKDEDFITFKGLIDGKYPDVKKLVSRWIEDIPKEKVKSLTFRADNFITLGKIGKLIGKKFSTPASPVRQYNRASISGIENIFTFPQANNLMYVVTNIKHENINDGEKYAVMMDHSAIEREIIEDIIDSGFSIKCGVSRHAYKTAVRCAKNSSRVAFIVDYDDKHFIDANAEIWDYACRVDVKKEHDDAKSK